MGGISGGTAGRSRLDTLTSIRFIAAALIVIGHGHEAFGSAGIANTFQLAQGVSVFFVLSGFILAYNYEGRLGSTKEKLTFFLARFARLWPLHIVTILILVFLLPNEVGGYLPSSHIGITLLANIFLIQSWSTIKSLCLSLNGVAWSISVEMFFYLCLPVLLFKWRKTWVIKILITVMAVITCIIFANKLALTPDDSYAGTGLFGVIYANPITRIFEFTLGIMTCYLYKNLLPLAGKLKAYEATFLEISVIVFSISSMWITPILSYAYDFHKVMGNAGQRWIEGSGSCFVFTLMILVLSFQKGYISKLLSNKFFVLLGEISFAVYLIHTILLKFFEIAILPVVDFPLWSVYIVYWATLLLMSYLLFTGVEKPCRKLIINIPKNIVKYKERKKSNNSHLEDTSSKKPFVNKKELISLLSLVIIVLTIRFVIGDIALYVSEKEANGKFNTTERQEYSFDNKFLLSSISVDSENDNLEMIWETQKDEHLKYSTAIHVLDSKETIIYSKQIIQNINMRHVKNGTVWKTKIKIPKDIFVNASSLGIVVYERPLSTQLFLPVVSGTSDWDGHRLIIPKEKLFQKLDSLK